MSRKVKSATHSEQLLAGVSGLLSDTTHKHSDVQLKVGGNIFYCHKLVLALKSPYFEQKLFPSSSSSAAAAAAEAAEGDKQIVLNDVSGVDFHKVLQFIYTGETELNEETVENILRAADLLKLTELTMFCVDYLTDRVSTATCPRYWKLAEQMNLARLALACKRQCLKEFDTIGRSAELSSLSEAMMRELLEDDELVVESEVDVCETLMKWLNSQTRGGHSVQPYHLLTLVRWSSVPVEYVKSKLITDTILMRDRQCFEFLSKVISYLLTGVQFHGLNTFHRPSAGVEQCLVIVGGNDETDIIDILCISVKGQDHFQGMTPAIPTSIQSQNVGLAACVSGKELYITGIGSKMNEAWKWESTFGWTKCADMNESRCGHCAIFVNNTSMYVLGGFCKEVDVATNSIEQYNTVTNKWKKVGQLMQATSTADCVVYKTSIYVFGGTEKKDSEPHDRVQVFDTATKLCTELTVRMPRPEPLIRAVMWDKSVILINPRTCLIFDIEQQTFQQRDQFATDVFCFGLALENQRIYVAGGVTEADTDEEIGSDEVKSVAVMDIISNQPSPNWKHHAKLTGPTTVLAYASMTLQI